MKFQTAFKDLYEGFLLNWKASRRYSLYNFILSFVVVLLPLATFWYIKEIIDLITKHASATTGAFTYSIISLVIVQLLYAITQQVLNDVQLIQQQLVVDDLSKKVLKKAISVAYPYYENAAYFNSLHVAQQEVMYRSGLLTSGFNQVLQNGLSMLIIAALFLQFNFLYGVLIVVASVPVLYVKWKHIKATQQLEMENLLSERKANYLSRMLTDAVHAKEVRTFLFGDFFIEKFTELRQNIFHDKKKLSSKHAWTEILIQIIEVIILAGIIYNLGVSTLQGSLTAGAFIFYLQALQRIQSAFRNFIQSFTLVFRQRFFLNNIFNFLNIESRTNSKTYSLTFPNHLKKGITVSQVSFSYSGADPLVINNINMHFFPGKVTAIIGENGSGKSTLVKLLMRLYQPSSGKILIDDVDISQINDEAYCNKVSALFQDYNQYHFSLEQNIVLGDIKDEERLSSVERDADLTALRESLPSGYETVLGKMFGNDLQLSGGQWQKIAIAKMLYRKAEVLIMDEPTSNIDPLAEYEILKKITAEKQNKIIILVTHRLHNLKFADHVYLMENGRVSAEGSPGELLNNNPLFRKMYQRQDIETLA